MAHRQQREFCNRVRSLFPKKFADPKVLDVGSLDVNGNNRFLFRDGSYVGCDVVAGKNVDFVGPCWEVKSGPFSVVISTEMLEHDPTWETSLAAMAQMLDKSGLLLITCAGPGRAEHGTRKHPHADMGACTSDYYRNLDCHDLMGVLAEFSWEKFHVEREHTSHDTYLYAIRG